ncbi:phosphoglycolate phosphatase [Oceanibaculum nanhaiense]|uniref:phosphoglycolate phosphatase n=1 Tax=Oceanibaculum nanhaiense TaxID=1909734 RepID=UPI00396D32A4
MSRTALAFDLDGTLIDSAPDLCAALNRLLTELDRPPVTLAQVKGFIGDGVRLLVGRALTATGDEAPEDETARHVARFLDIYEAIPATPAQLYPGVDETLARLKADGFRLGLCTNKPQQATDILLPQLGLGGVFDCVVGGDALPVRKPDAGHLQAVLDRLGGIRADSAMIGDNENDAAVAAGCGVPFIAMAYGYPRVPVAELGAALVLERFADLPDALKTLA